MPVSSIIVLALIVGAFSLFGVTLAYGEYQTRHLKRLPEEPEKVREKEDLRLAA